MPRADTPYVSQLSAALRASILAWRDALPPGGAAAAFAPLAGHERLPETEVLLGRLFEELGKFANVRGGAVCCAPGVEGATMCLRPRPTYSPTLPPTPQEEFLKLLEDNSVLERFAELDRIRLRSEGKALCVWGRAGG